MKQLFLFLNMTMMVTILFNCSSWQLKENFHKIERGMTTKQVSTILKGSVPTDKEITSESEVWVFDFYNNWNRNYEGSKKIVFIKGKVDRIETDAKREKAIYQAIAKRKKQEAERQMQEKARKIEDERTCYCSYECSDGTFGSNQVLGKEDKNTCDMSCQQSCGKLAAEKCKHTEGKYRLAGQCLKNQ
ncbi:MAG: hypothetical protein KDK90_26965 [Leptospiraceae bacterium]|nr:hypothetical protein [Leptospiraceae bacterium]